MNRELNNRSDFHKSTYSGASRECVEIAALEDGRIAVRDSKNGGVGPVLVFAPAAWNDFVRGVADDEFKVTTR